MVSSHSMYKHPSKIAKATEAQKANSSLQLKINFWEKKYNKLMLSHKIRLSQLRLLSEGCNKLVKDGVVKKEFFSPYMLNKKEIVRKYKLNQVNGNI